jgi:hypothetical protein
MNARSDATTRANLDDLAKRFHQSRAAVVCHIMKWRLNRVQTGPLDRGDTQGAVRHLSLDVDSALSERVEKAAIAVGMKTAAWLRPMVRQIRITDFPASWQKATPSERSHDSHSYGTRVMLRLDDPAQTKLQHSSRSLTPQKLTSSATSSPKPNPKIFPKAGT